MTLDAAEKAIKREIEVRVGEARGLRHPGRLGGRQLYHASRTTKATKRSDKRTPSDKRRQLERIGPGQLRFGQISRGYGGVSECTEVEPEKSDLAEGIGPSPFHNEKIRRSGVDFLKGRAGGLRRLLCTGKTLFVARKIRTGGKNGRKKLWIPYRPPTIPNR